MPKRGYECKLYRSTSGTWTGGLPPSLDEVANAREVSVPPEKDAIDVTTRGSGGVQQNLSGILKFDVSFKLVFVETDEHWTAFRDAFLNGDAVICAFLDGDLGDAGTQGPACYMQVFKFEVMQGEGDAVEAAIELKPTVGNEVTFEWVTV